MSKTGKSLDVLKILSAKTKNIEINQYTLMVFALKDSNE